MEAREESIALGAVATSGATDQDGDVYCEMLEDGELVEEEATSVPQDEQTETKDSVSLCLISLRALADQSFRSRPLSIPTTTSKPPQRTTVGAHRKLQVCPMLYLEEV